MTKRRPIEQQIIEFFQTAPVDAAMSVYRIAGGIVKERQAGNPRVGVTDLRPRRAAAATAEPRSNAT